MKKTKKNPLPLEQLLGRGSENAINGEQLARYYGLSRRDFQKLVQQKRDEGVPIIAKKSGGGGFYLPADGYELMSFIGEWEGQIQTQLNTRNALIQTYEQEYKKKPFNPERQRAH